MEKQTEGKESNLPLSKKVVDHKTDDTKTNQNISLNGKTWPDIFQDFFDTPPTKSFLRLYLLCWILWNRSLILFILFSDKDMMHKLDFHIWSYYVTGSFHNHQLYVYANMYLMPLFLYGIIWYIVFKKISPAGWNTTFFRNFVWKVSESEKNAFSLYNWQHSRHIEDQKMRVQAEREEARETINLLSDKIEYLNKKIQIEAEKNKLREVESSIGYNLDNEFKKYTNGKALWLYDAIIDFSKSNFFVGSKEFFEKYFFSIAGLDFQFNDVNQLDYVKYRDLLIFLCQNEYIESRGTNKKYNLIRNLLDNKEALNEILSFTDSGKMFVRAVAKYLELAKDKQKITPHS